MVLVPGAVVVPSMELGTRIGLIPRADRFRWHDRKSDRILYKTIPWSRGSKRCSGAGLFSRTNTPLFRAALLHNREDFPISGFHLWCELLADCPPIVVVHTLHAHLLAGCSSGWALVLHFLRDAKPPVSNPAQY
jgi:hypothetical protein